jgi:16S rRNA (adenine1518-N6/adenine1519-N6)-dimethyltransferase
MDKVRAKKHLGQHFLTEVSIAERIAQSLTGHQGTANVLEIGPGTGMLTRALLACGHSALKMVELDADSVSYLRQRHPELSPNIIEGDFLKLQLSEIFDGQPFGLTGNFPYNISSQILFKLVEQHELIPEMVGMFQREVARRIASPEGSKEYGILSVLLQVFYNVEYLFTVNEGCFSPPPKVKSGVVRLSRNDRKELPIPEAFFKHVVKSAFGQRRKTLRNSLSAILKEANTEISAELLSLRPERLSPTAFIDLAVQLYPGVKSGTPALQG